MPADRLENYERVELIGVEGSWSSQMGFTFGAKNVIIANNIFRVPLNYAAYIGSDDAYAEGARALQDILIVNNQITDLVAADRYGNPFTIDTGIVISQWAATPENVVVRGNTLAQRTATTGLSWSELKLRGIDGENRQWRLDVDSNIVWLDEELVDEVFVGNCKAIRVEAPNGLDRIAFDINDNHCVGFSADQVMRSTTMWSGTHTWAPAAALTEFPVGAPARLSGVDLRGYFKIRLVATVGGNGGLADTVLPLRYSVDGGTTWADSGAVVTLDGNPNQAVWGGWADMPDALRQSFGVLLSAWTQDGDGSTQLTLTNLQVDVENIDQTSAARLLPLQVLPAEKQAADGTALRSYAPADIADIGFAATAGADGADRYQLYPGAG